MLLEFRLRNFRSFRDETTLSLIAASDTSLEDTNTFPTAIRSLPRAVRSAVIFGANASGKSNIVLAMNLMRGVVVQSAALQPQQLFNVQPFRLDNETAGQPTMFEVTVLIGGTRYQYGFEFTSNRILAEWLLVYQTAKPQTWFDRRFDQETGKDVFAFSSHLTGPRRIWEESTRPNALLLSTAVQLNSESLAPLHAWFVQDLVVALDGGLLPFDHTTKLLQTQEGQARVNALLASADIAISSVSAEPIKGFRQSVHFDLASRTSSAQFDEPDLLVPKFRHTLGEVSVDFDLPDESQGTQKLFSLAGPLFDVLENGRLLVVDELDRSLHPLLVRQIIQTFQDPALNRHGAQLVFTTHDAAQLDPDVLRRDQVWFTEKGADQASELTPLMIFSPRKGEALEKRYLEGRYGGVPILPNRMLDWRGIRAER